jgi:cytochrome b involved in lipid metabolism
VIIQGKVFDVTKFLKDHPGGKRVLLKVAGQDATEQFASFHAQSVLTKYSPELLIGEVNVRPLRWRTCITSHTFIGERCA